MAFLKLFASSFRIRDQKAGSSFLKKETHTHTNTYRIRILNNLFLYNSLMTGMFVSQCDPSNMWVQQNS